MKKKIDWDLILSYLGEECSEEDKAEVLEWENASNENKKELEVLRKIWNSPDTSLPEPDIELALKAVKNRIDNYSRSGAVEGLKVFKLKPDQSEGIFKRYIFNTNFVKAAALLLLTLAGIYFVSTLLQQSSSMLEMLVDNKAQQNIILSDGTKIILDAGSLLKYPEKFEDKSREVFLNGEGYFDVAQNSDSPFIIITNTAKIQVVGTKFNVRAWEKSNKVVVAVGEGKVRLQSETSENLDNSVLISKGKMSELDEHGVPTNPIDTDINKHISWMNRELHFQGTPFGEILDQLKRWYDVEFDLPSKSYLDTKVSVYIEDKPIEDIVNMISIMMNFKYEMQGNKILFSIAD